MHLWHAQVDWQIWLPQLCLIPAGAPLGTWELVQQLIIKFHVEYPRLAEALRHYQ